MGMVAPRQRIASAFVVVCGQYGDVGRSAAERGVCRQAVYRESARVVAALDASTGWRQQVHTLQHELRQSQQRVAELEAALAQAVVLDRDKQAEVACVAQAIGISLSEVYTLLDTLRPGGIAPVATLGRWTQAAGAQASALLAVLDGYTRDRVRQAAADEIYVRDPVLMVVEPESLCWVSGRLTDAVTGKAWAEQFRALPALEQVTRDAGSALANGVTTVQDERQEQQQPALADQLDHLHTLRGGSQGVRKAEHRVRSALVDAEEAQAALDRRRRHGQSENGYRHKARDRWAKASQAMDTWQARDETWQKAKAALQRVTPEASAASQPQPRSARSQTPVLE
jgi:hypothetical protein